MYFVVIILTIYIKIDNNYSNKLYKIYVNVISLSLKISYGTILTLSS